MKVNIRVDGRGAWWVSMKVTRSEADTDLEHYYVSAYESK